ncbi:MAG TPA: hypothetical protein VM915_10510 [Verrucomicrobiae bacterium]|nr:hypothetical protein [Verrucomicrobiae bacterium]
MRYRVEFLRRASEEDSVCFERSAEGSDLQLIEFQAQAWAEKAQTLHGARAWQIRDMKKKGRIVSVESFSSGISRVH